MIQTTIKNALVISMSLLVGLPYIAVPAWGGDAESSAKPAETAATQATPVPSTTGQPTPPAAPTKTDAAIPPWLKEYAPPPTKEPEPTKGETDKPAADAIDSIEFKTGGASGSAPSQNQTGSTSAPTNPQPAIQPPASRPTSSPQLFTRPTAEAAKPKMLFGRIEEISGKVGATLPFKIQLQAQKPILDPRAIAAQAQSLRGAVSSFPVDFRGVWSGTLTIHTAQFDKTRFEFDADEAAEEQRVLRPGRQGSVSFNFYQGSGNHIALEPAQIYFSVPMGQTAQGSQMANELKQMGAMFGGSVNIGQLMGNTPAIAVMHLGSLSNATGPTGNALSAQVVKNDVRQLKEGVLEQDLVTYGQDYNPKTGRTRNSFSETVLRFTRISPNQLYVQAADVNYRPDGHFQNKYLLYGTVNRGQAAQIPGMPGMMPGGMQIPGLTGGNGSGAGGLDQLLKGLQGF
jgi:hypothetical protein